MAGNRPIIMINTNNSPEFCDNRCNNRKCSRHKSNMLKFKGVCRLRKLRDTEMCEGYISKWKQSHEEIKEIEKEMEAAGHEKDNSDRIM